MAMLDSMPYCAKCHARHAEGGFCVADATSMPVASSKQYTLIERLTQLADSKAFGPMPPFLDQPNGWGTALIDMATEALALLTWRPIDTAPVPAWDSPEARRGYNMLRCLGQLARLGANPPWITTIEAYYVAAPRSTEKRILRWRDGGGRQVFPKYWMPMPATRIES